MRRRQPATNINDPGGSSREETIEQLLRARKLELPFAAAKALAFGELVLIERKEPGITLHDRSSEGILVYTLS